MSHEVKIRPATLSDAPAILKHVQTTYENAFPKNKMFSVDAEHASSTIAAAIDGKEACALVATDDKGVLLALAIGVLSPSLFNFDFLTLYTLIFWVSPETRKSGVGTLLAKSLESWGAGKGAGAFAISNTRGSFDSAMGRLCKRVGMHPKELMFIKRVGVV